jgi:uncharacterized membrane protein YdbT with pleckstrin-like domain
MSYARSVLQPGETIVAIGRLHWIIYWPAILSLVAGTVLVWWVHRRLPEQDVLIMSTSLIFSALFVVTFLYAWFVRWISEFAVTNKRVIRSKVFIRRKTEEMSMDKVETVDIDQPVIGRLLDYGTISVTGTGGTNEIVEHRIAAPFRLRNAIITK